MKQALLALVMVVLLTGCNTPPLSTKVDSTPQAIPSAPQVSASSEPIVRFQDRQVFLPEGFRAEIPQEGYAFALMILLPDVGEDVANISFAECPKGAPDSGCIGNHRAITKRGTATLAGISMSQFEAEFMKNSASADDRTWLELHTIALLPSGRRIDIIGQVLTRSGKETMLRSVYGSLLNSLHHS